MAVKKRKKLPKDCPTSVRVMGKVFKIVAATLDTDYGTMDPMTLTITIDPAAEGEGNIEDTLLHELVHAAESHAGLKYNEKWVRPISSGLLSILKDNPALVAFLLGAEGVRQVMEARDVGHAPV